MASGERFLESAADFAKAIEIQPGNPDAYFARGDAHRSHKIYEDAVAAYTRYLNLSAAAGGSANLTAYENRGEANYAAQHYDAAIADYANVIALQPQQARNVYAFLGASYVQEKDYASAADAYTDYVAREKQGAGINPINDLKAAVAREPNNMGLRRSLADPLVNARDYVAAIEQYTIIINDRDESERGNVLSGPRHGVPQEEELRQEAMTLDLAGQVSGQQHYKDEAGSIGKQLSEMGEAQ